MRERVASRIVQNCYVVNNLEDGCARWQALFGIAPFIGGGDIELRGHVYRGEPAEPIRLRGVFAQSGDLNIELIELVSTGPSAFREMFGAGEEGLHHVAMFSDDYEGEKACWTKAGCPVASEFTTDFGAKICYIDARSMLGHYIELYPEHAVIRGMYDQTVQESRDWDGERLILPWR